MSAKKKTSWKKKLSSGVGTVVGMVAGGGIGIYLGTYAEHVAGDNMLSSFGLMAYGMVMLAVAFLLHIVCHEGGHLIAGLMSGYRFLSFNVFGVVWTKGADGRIRCGRMQIAGAGGQCLMSPPAYNGGDFPFTLYNLGGVIVNLILAAVCLPLAILAYELPFLYLFLAMMALVGLLSAVMNGLPLPMEAIQNDGKNLVCIRRDLHARRAFWVQMSLAAASAGGTRLKDMPEDWFQIAPDAPMDNALVASVAVFEASRRMDALDLAGAEKAIHALLDRKKGVLGLYRTTLCCDGATCEMIAGRPGELTQALSEPAHQQIIKAMKEHPSILRTQYALALLNDRDAQKAESLLADFEKAAPKHANPSEIIGERELIALIQKAAENLPAKAETAEEAATC